MYSEIVSLFHPPNIVKVLGIVGLSYRLLMCIQQMQNGSHPCRKLKFRYVLMYSEIVSLFQPPTKVKVLRIVRLSFRLPMYVQQMQNCSNTCRK